MYNWKKRLLAAVLAGCMTVGLMAPALATVGGEDTASTAVDPGFSVDPVYPVEPTDPVEPVEPTPPVETEIPDGEIPLDPGFGMHDWANMSTEELYEVVKDLSDEDRAIVYSLLTEEQIAALEEYEKAMELPPVMDYESMSNEELYAYGMENLTAEERVALLDQLSEERRADFLAFVEEYESALLPEVSEEDDYSVVSDEIDVGPIVHYDTPSLAAEVQNNPMRAMALDGLAAYGAGDAPEEGGPVTDPSDGSITYDNNVKINKKLSDTNRDTAAGENIYELDLSAEAVSNVVTGFSAVDIVLMLDLSSYMNPTTTATYTPIDGTPGMSYKNFYNQYRGREFYYRNPSNGRYQLAKITENDWGLWSDYYISSEGEQIEKNGWGNDNVRNTYYLKQNGETVDNLASLKMAVSNFVGMVAGKSPKSRIAIVGYGNNSTEIFTGAEATSDALWEVGAKQQDLLAIVDNLTVRGGTSDSDLAMADAVNIFQDVPAGTEEYGRDRVALMFSAGMAYDGLWTDSSSNTRTNANGVAQASMHLATILKAPKGESANGTNSTGTTINWASNFYGGGGWSEQGFRSQYRVSYDGCGATVYTVGLNLPKTPDPAQENIWGLDGARVNEYMYRISQARPTGEHYKPDDSRFEWGSQWNQIRSQHPGWYNEANGFYADGLTRNLKKGYFLTADSDEIGRLEEIFEEIANQVGEGAEVSVIDYIDPAFTLVDETGQPLSEGATITSHGGGDNVEYTGTVKKDGKGYYIEWKGVELDPGDEEEQGAKKFAASLYIISNDTSFGGNQVPTNIGSASGVSTGDKFYKFPEPHVNLPVNYQVAGTVTTIPVGTGVDYDELIAYMEGYQPDGVNNAHVNIVYTLKQGENVIGTYTILASQTTGNWERDPGSTGALTSCQAYTLECTVTPSNPGTMDSLGNPAVGAETCAPAVPQIHVLEPTITWKDSTVEAGTTLSDYAENEGGIVWADANNDSADVSAANDWEVLYRYDPQPGTINQETPVDVTVTVNGTDITQYVTFVRTCETTTTHGETHPGSDTKCEFVIHLNNIDLSIRKNLNEKPEQSFVFKVEGPDGFTMTIAMGDDEFQLENGLWTCTKKITGLKSGNYTVTEDQGWSWKYSVQGDARKDAVADSNQNLSVTFTNDRNSSNWLGGSHSVENHFAPVSGSSAGTIDTLDALVPPLPTGEKKQENEDDQKKTEPDPGEDPDLDGMTQEGGVDHV
ncbi:MAG: hypothetical protein KHZ05_05740 [Oscillospiraceae bacterium]|nr:hypothetical protein [Oscillospiraceae bacterium]